MRHGVGYRKFQKSAAHTRAMLRNIATSLLLHEQIETTVQKAKELRPVVEKLITRAKKDTLPNRRHAYSYLMDKAVVHKLFTDIGPRFATRNGGYTRIIQSRLRAGDKAAMAVISLVELGTKGLAPKVAAEGAEPKAKKEKAPKAAKAEKAPKAEKAAKAPKAPKAKKTETADKE